MLYPRSDKFTPSLPVLILLLLASQLAKTNIEREENTDLSCPKDQRPGDQGPKTWRVGEKPGDLSMDIKKT